MALEQRALVVRVHATDEEGLAALNVELQRGWRVAHVTPLGGTGLDAEGEPPAPFLAALVIIERHDEDEDAVVAEAIETVQEAEDEPEEIVEEVVEENGAGSPPGAP